MQFNQIFWLTIFICFSTINADAAISESSEITVIDEGDGQNKTEKCNAELYYDQYETDSEEIECPEVVTGTRPTTKTTRRFGLATRSRPTRLRPSLSFTRRSTRMRRSRNRPAFGNIFGGLSDLFMNNKYNTKK
jgi:hypothetical protein